MDCKSLSSKDSELLAIILHSIYSRWIGRLARQCVGLENRTQVTECYSCHPFCFSDSVKIEDQFRFRSSFYSSILWHLCDSYHSFNICVIYWLYVEKCMQMQKLQIKTALLAKQLNFLFYWLKSVFIKVLIRMLLPSY